ncbi:MAG: glycosyltransferase, partial [Ferruginibacter sp.]|nr:glycosyltransferase [Cytophagales bacterium]
MEKIILFLYCLALLFILGNSLVQANLIYHYLKSYRRRTDLVHAAGAEPFTTGANAPFVTVQLPIYNELYVIERLMEAVASFQYPKDRFEIQVLDDSIDATSALVARKAAEIRARGIPVHHRRRNNRAGFKAGALAAGLPDAKGELVAIFDADFVPTPDFLQKTVSYFKDPVIGVVQARWEHLNETYSLLTRVQAFALDSHFSVEQQGRQTGGYFINFNGTAGIWRKACIVDAGGWHSDTLTEDLDLSYRAQLRGWKLHYLESLGAPAELPVAMNAFKTQQFRWTKGAAECARKNLLAVLRSKSLTLGTKIHASFHLMNSFLFICLVVMALLSLPILVIKHEYVQYAALFDLASVFVLSQLLLVVFYWVSFATGRRKGHANFLEFLQRFLLFLSISMGLSLHNAIAVLEGYLGRKTPFIR